LTLVTVGGCLAMVFMSLVASSITTEFFRELGATELQFGLLGGLPMIMLSLQFLGAYLYVTGRIRRRKPIFMFMLIACRLLFVPMALLPLLMPQVPGWYWIVPFIALSAASSAMNNLVTPLWLSWMGDLVPRPLINRYWAERQRYMQLVWTAAFLAVTLFILHSSHWPVRSSFALLAMLGVAAGIADILLFIRVPEPETHTGESEGIFRTLVAPLRDAHYRGVVLFNCFFVFSTMFAAAFWQIYLLKILRVELWKTNLMWCVMGIGVALIARTWGRLADRHGQRPVLVLSVALKPWIALAFLLATPANAFWFLSIVFFFDSMANSGHIIANNGFMMKVAPRNNRAMFAAATQALSGIAGGLGAILSGYALQLTDNFHLDWAGRDWNHYHLIFFISFWLRMLCIPMALRIREPDSGSSALVLSQLLEGWPMRYLLVPIDFCRKLLPGSREDESGRRG
jgi:MFS family permease